MATIFNKIIDAINIFRGSEIKQVNEMSDSKVVPTGYETQSYGYELQEKKTEFLNELRGWVASAIRPIADEIATTRFRLFKNTDKGVEELDIEDHPAIEILYRANNITSKFDHFWLTQVYLDLVGEAPWYLDKDNKGNIKSVFLLRPDFLSPYIGTEKLIAGYKYRLGNNTIDIPIGNILLLKYPNPANPMRGIGTLQMAARVVDIDNYAEEWNKLFYENAAHPDSILNVKVDNMNREQLDHLKHSIKEQYQGLKKAHNVMVLFGDMDWKKIGFSQKDMDFLQQQKFSRDKIFGIFGVPKAIASQTEDVNYASAKVAQYVFDRYTIRPKLERIVQQLNEFFLPAFKDSDDLFFSFDDPVDSDIETDMRVYSMAINSGIMSINEVRERLKLQPIEEGGDDIYLPVNLMPTGETQVSKKLLKFMAPKVISKKYGEVYNLDERIRISKAINPIGCKVDKAKKIISDKVFDILKSQLVGKNNVNSSGKSEEVVFSKVITPEQKMIFWEKKNAITSKYLKEVKKAIIKIFLQQRKKVLMKFRNLKVIKVSPLLIYDKVKLDIRSEVENILKITFPIFENLFKDAGDVAYDLLDVNMEMDVTREEIKKVLQTEIRNFSTVFNETTNEQLKKVIVEALTQGESLEEVKNRVKILFNEAETYRADRIAETETARFNNASSEQAYIDSGIVEGKEWFINPGACSFCIPMSGKIVKLGNEFFERGETIEDKEGNSMTLDYETVMHPPLHVNCACQLIPIFKK